MRHRTAQIFRTGWMWVVAAAVALPAAVSAVPPAPTEGRTLELEYKVFIRGIRVGAARIRAETGDGRYRLCGRMHTTDIWARLAPWEATFDVRGRIEETVAVPETLRMHERARKNARKKKERLVHVAEGVLRQVRDGERQEDQPAPDGVDIMSFFWVTARCDAELVLNNGRKSYAMALRERTRADDGVERCDYEFLDKDEDRDGDKDRKTSPALFVIVDRHGRRVPETVTMPGSLPRRLKLGGASIVETAAEHPAAACSVPALMDEPRAEKRESPAAGDRSKETVHNPPVRVVGTRGG